MEYAGFWCRGAAMTIDGLLLGVAQAVATIALVAGASVDDLGDEAAVGYVLLFNLAIFAGMWLYFALLESSAKQATLGKMLVGVVVTDIGGGRVSFGRASGRFFAKIPSWAMLTIGFLMAAFTERKQALHDIMAGCLVIRKPTSV